MRTLDRGWRRPAPTVQQLRADVWIGVGAALVCVLSVELFRSAFGVSLGWRGIEAYGWFAVAGLALAGRRRLPLTTLVVESAIFIAVGERIQAFGTTFTIQMVLFAALYAAWAWSRQTRRLYVVSAVVLVTMFGWLAKLISEGNIGPVGDPGLMPPLAAAIAYSLIVNVVYFFGAMAWGHAAWMSARRRALIDEQLVREREQHDAERRRAVQTERVRIARDLHDVVAHHVSGIGVQAAGASRLLQAKPDAARKALGTIETSSRQAVTQMHQLVGLLREAEEGVEGGRAAERGPQPTLADIAALAQPGPGPAVEFREVGEARSVPPTVGVSLFRIAQEAITNVRRHAGAHTATITLRHLAGIDGGPAVEIEIVDDGRGTSSRGDHADSGGFGLAGIRERAEMHDGATEIGPRPHGGFRVRVRVPLDPVESPA